LPSSIIAVILHLVVPGGGPPASKVHRFLPEMPRKHVIYHNAVLVPLGSAIGFEDLPDGSHERLIVGKPEFSNQEIPADGFQFGGIRARNACGIVVVYGRAQANGNGPEQFHIRVLPEFLTDIGSVEWDELVASAHIAAAYVQKVAGKSKA